MVATLVALPTLLILLTMLGLIDPSAGPGASINESMADTIRGDVPAPAPTRDS